MNRHITAFGLLFVCLVFLASGSNSRAFLQEPDDNAPAIPTLAPDAQLIPTGSGMPSRPLPSHPIPHHEPGQPFRGGEATYQAAQLDALGEAETVTLTGMDALLANGTISDPLQSNYRLVDLDKVMFGSYDLGSNNFSVQSFEFVTPTLGVIPTSTVNYGNMRVNAIATGDLNGDLVDEQIAAYVASGPFPNSSGWTAAQYYKTIQTADIDGDGQAELLARSPCGMDTWDFDKLGSSWEPTSTCNPPWSDANGWDDPKYYSTIQTADIDRDGRAELLARAHTGMVTWRFNVSSNTWESVVESIPPWSDDNGWGGQEHYSTIQTADVDGDGQAELLARGAAGMETWRFNVSNTWESVVGSIPPWSDDNGWDNPKYYSTIQTADVDGVEDGRAELLARGAAGMETWRFISNTWELVAESIPPWSDANGWGGQEHYSTIQTADVDGDEDGRAELLARGAAGMETWRFNVISNTWESVVGSNPPWSDDNGWDGQEHYSTIQTADVDGDGRAELLARGAAGMETWRFNVISNTWESVVGSIPPWSDGNGWDRGEYYSTIQTADIDGDGQAELLARAVQGDGDLAFQCLQQHLGWTTRARDSVCHRRATGDSG